MLFLTRNTQDSMTQSFKKTSLDCLNESSFYQLVKKYLYNYFVKGICQLLFFSCTMQEANKESSGDRLGTLMGSTISGLEIQNLKKSLKSRLFYTFQKGQVWRKINVTVIKQARNLVYYRLISRQVAICINLTRN